MLGMDVLGMDANTHIHAAKGDTMQHHVRRVT